MTDAKPLDRVNILLVDDQPARLLAYETILSELGETLIMARSATEALNCLLHNEVAVILVDVCMPELDGYELAAMIRQSAPCRSMNRLSDLIVDTVSMSRLSMRLK